MALEDHSSPNAFSVVINDEEQYSIWPVGNVLPNGWLTTGAKGSKDECLSFIKDAWTDMRPASLREHMEGGRT